MDETCDLNFKEYLNMGENLGIYSVISSAAVKSLKLDCVDCVL